MIKTAHKPRYNSGFTLIELLIVIAIVAIMGTLGLYGFGAAQKRARDAQRKSDLAQYRTSLESYANKNNGFYPSRTSAVPAATTLCTDLGLTSAACADDPINSGNYIYYYLSDGTNGTASATEFVLYEYLESPSPSTNVYTALCSSGTTLSQAALPTLASCP